MPAARFTILTSARSRGPLQGDGNDRGASNRSRNGFVSSAPLGHSFSGGLFFGILNCTKFIGNPNFVILGFIEGSPLPPRTIQILRCAQNDRLPASFMNYPY
jgi:hypothetical protein